MTDIYNQSGKNRFDDVDATSAPEDFIRYLQGVSTGPSVSEYIGKSIVELGLREGLSHLEIGCGLADDLGLLAAGVGTSGRITLLDNSRAMETEAMAQVTKLGSDHCAIEFKLADAHTLPFKDNSFDTTRVVRVLQHLDDPGKVITEMARVIKPGGKLCAVEPNWYAASIDSDYPSVTQIFLGDLHASVKNPGIGGQLVELCRNAGLNVERFESMAFTFGTLDEAAVTITFDNRLKKLIQIGELTQDQADQWLNDLRIRSRSGEFNTTITRGFVVAKK